LLQNVANNKEKCPKLKKKSAPFSVDVLVWAAWEIQESLEDHQKMIQIWCLNLWRLGPIAVTVTRVTRVTPGPGQSRAAARRSSSGIWQCWHGPRCPRRIGWRRWKALKALVMGNFGFWPTNCWGSARFTEHGLGLGCGYFVERCELRDGLDVFICLEDLTWRTWDEDHLVDYFFVLCEKD